MTGEPNETTVDAVRRLIGDAGRELAELHHDGAVHDLQAGRDAESRWQFVDEVLAPSVIGIIAALEHLAAKVDDLDAQVGHR